MLLWLLLLLLVVLWFLFADADATLLWYHYFRRNSAKLQGKVIWITGASAGIGAELAVQLAKHKAKLIISARREQELVEVKKRCPGADVLIIPFDVADTSCHAKVVSEVLATVGRVDVLVNNAGRSQRALVDETVLATDVELFQLNVFGTISLTKELLPSMLKSGKGHIVVTSSVAGKFGAPASASYAATKHAIQGFFDTMRMELSLRGISVTMVCPGPVVSDGSATAITASGGTVGKANASDAGKMATARCVELIMTAIANELDEIWISQHPILFFTYVAQYCPSIFCWLGKHLGHRRATAFKSGAKNINSSLLKWKSN
eukprot:TRINITY_DN1964_c0_g1_i1.p1 TRINITY_DN1964_c0_g1~~TRINITY_DN1964_c0_g1_i1.p1  ORF type:complete len:320 (-),score=45.76 TRINITY_DN1964_c0_g1_i1:101-1060(-)